MSTTSSKFGFTLPDGSDSFDKDKYLNGNFQKVEDLIYSKTEADTNYAKKAPTVTWNALTFQNAFYTLGLSAGDPKWYKTDDGIVYLKGCCGAPASGFQNVPMFTLPAGARPSTTINLTLGAVTIAIFSSGQVQFTSATAANVQLGMISFPAEF